MKIDIDLIRAKCLDFQQALSTSHLERIALDGRLVWSCYKISSLGVLVGADRSPVLSGHCPVRSSNQMGSCFSREVRHSNFRYV